jgi:hypothetical protein
VSSEAFRRRLQTFLTSLGLVAFIAGLATVVFGVASIVGAEDVSGTVDSEMRFYATWYAAAGAVVLRSARRLDSEGWVIRGVAAAVFVAGCSRALSWVTVGEPHVVAKVLMIVELVLPFIIVPWHAAIVRQPSKRSK